MTTVTVDQAASDPAALGAGPGAAAPAEPTIWGLTAVELYDRYWAARGVQVVRRGEASEVVDDAELFLLTDADRLMIFRLRPIITQITWVQPRVAFIRLHDNREHGYREVARCDDEGRFLGFERRYGGGDPVRSRVALTSDRLLAEAWQRQDTTRDGWRMLRRRAARRDRAVRSAPASVYDRRVPEEVMALLRRLAELWATPTTTVERIRKAAGETFVDRDAEVHPQVQCVGPVWVGAGRRLDAGETVVGPALLWDAPDSRPHVEHVRWDDIEPSPAMTGAFEPAAASPLRRPFHHAAKRAFDLVFASLALLLTLPLWPLIMLAIAVEDGRPIFFAHRRETLGGREFPCLKFRSMRKDAEEIKRRIARDNQVDGPQFYIDNDPRATRVGRFLRDTQLDELPQLLNVIAGHMSLVGPRPSPRKENQYCPPWRETRLSVRPGITGLWQIRRTRETGLDFQEWIRYDIEYVENASFWLDLRIILGTVRVLLRRNEHKE